MRTMSDNSQNQKNLEHSVIMAQTHGFGVGYSYEDPLKEKTRWERPIITPRRGGKGNAVSLNYYCLYRKAAERDKPVRRITRSKYNEINALRDKVKRAEEIAKAAREAYRNLEQEIFADAEPVSWEELNQMAKEATNDTH